MPSHSPDLAKGGLTQFVIVVPTKNRRVLLERALGSVLSQDYNAYRIVVINDGSIDETHAYLDSLDDPRVQIIHFEKSRGVNAARNAALRTLEKGEWAVQLDDDDMLLPKALRTIAGVINEVPESVQILFFNTVIRTPTEEFTGGRFFKEGERYHDITYEEIMGGKGKRGDSRAVMKWTLFPKYFFREDINGLESEWFLLLARDGVGIRYVPEQTMWIDLSHPGEHLSAVAVRRDPASFVRAHLRNFHDHATYLADHPEEAMDAAFNSLKVALRAYDIPHAFVFVGYYLQSLWRLVFSRHSQK